MASKTTDALALRDETGAWFLLTAEMLAAAKATVDQEAELNSGVDEDTTGFLIYTKPFGRMQMVPAAGGAKALVAGETGLRRTVADAAPATPAAGLIRESGRSADRLIKF